MRILLVMIFLALIKNLSAQQKTLTGIILSSAGKPIAGATVLRLKSDSSGFSAFAISKADGSFVLNTIANGNSIRLEIRHISFETKKIDLDTSLEKWSDGISVTLLERTKELQEVVIKRELPVITRSDTIVFNANSYKTPEVRKVEDLLRNIQGFTVDPNGKLSFNGKSVEKVLIEGDDLADKGYQMITRNLDASMIDKIEVVDNFNNNRLMRNIEQTNKVGLNLKIASKYKARLSGSSEIGLSAQERFLADLNNIYIGKQIKWLGFFNYNNVARDPAGNVGYYYQQEGGQTDLEDHEAIQVPVLETGSINMPAIGDRHIKDNSDLGTAVMNSFKLGRFSRFSTLAGYNDLTLRNRAGSTVETHISDQEKWILNNVMSSQGRSKDLLVRGSFQQDRGKKHVTRIDLAFQAGYRRNGFSDLLSGTVKDSLDEKLKHRMNAVRLDWLETFMLKKEVLRMSMNYVRGSFGQKLNNWSQRYLSFWGLDSSYRRNGHEFEYTREFFQLQLKLNGHKGKWQYEYGAVAEYRKMSYLSQHKIMSEFQKPDLVPQPTFSDVEGMQAKGLFRAGLKTGKKGRLGVSGELGIERIRNDMNVPGFAVFSGSASYVHSISLLRSIRFKYSVFNGFAEYGKLYPIGLLSGNGTILNGLNFQGPESSHTVSGTWQSNNFYKQRNWSVSVNYKFIPRNYGLVMTAKPEFSEFGFGLTRNNKLATGVFNWESFVPAVKGRIGSSVNLNAARYKNRLNGVEGISERAGVNTACWWTSGFKSLINIELRGGTTYSMGRWNNGTRNSMWQHHSSAKFKVKAGNKWYGALSNNSFILSQGSRFTAMDLFISYQATGSLVLHVTGTNLLNTGRIRESSVMPYSSSQSSFYLVGRYILLSGNLSF